MLIRCYLVFGCIVLGSFTGLAATSVRMPVSAPSSGSGPTGPSSHGFWSTGWGFGK